MVEAETWGKIIRAVNLVAALVVGCAGIWTIITLQIFTDFQILKMWSIFTPIFLIIFAIMLVLADMRNETLFEYFNFMVSFAGRGIFYIFLGSIASYQMANINGSTTLAYVWGLVLFLFGFLFIGFHFTSAGGKLDGIKQEVGRSTGVE